MDLSYLLVAMTPLNLLMALVGTAAGIVMGALPGVGTILAVTLLLPFTFGMGADAGLILLGGVFGGAVYGGSICAILLNLPGTAASAVTSLDGNPLAKKGLAGYAIGITTVSSALGGLAGTFALIFVSPVLASFALQFGPREYFMLALTGLAMIARAAPQDTLKGLISGALGLFLGVVGLSTLSAYPRLTFGIDYLYDGIVLVPTVIGLFGLSEVLVLLRRPAAVRRSGEVGKGVLQGAMFPFRRAVTLVKSILIGAAIGACPGWAGKSRTRSRT